MLVARLRHVFVLLMAALPFSACMDRPVAPREPETTNIFVDRIPTARVERIDLLFMVDNSLSMADKQALLAEAVPRLVERLVDPLCVPREGTAPPQPSQGGQCPDGFKREFMPLADFHIGVISSSLGSHGGNGCDTGAANPDDHAHLMPFVRPGLKSYADTTGFLAWDPLQKQQPPGTRDVATLNADFKAHVQAAGEKGCGYEASLEAWYRFLIDPEPAAALGVEKDVTVPNGIDQLVIDQRKAFLRPDSLVAVIMLTDENDCSVIDEGPGWLVMRTDALMHRGSSDCARDPNSPCCRLCGAGEAAPPNGCVPLAQDSECMKNIRVELAPEVDQNLRCFDQKRRFGFDFLYPVGRYIDGLKNLKIKNRRGELVDNPLYTNLVEGGPAARTSDLVYLAGIVGVPWQDIATPETLNDARRLQYLPAENIPWDRVLGDPSSGPPKDSLMIETTAPRVGAPPHPLGGAAIAPPDAPNALANPINGHEHLVARELQYACTFPLDTNFATPGIQPRECGTDLNCDCNQAGVDGKKPLCQDPNTGVYSKTQWFAKAYPGVRHLQVLKGLGKNAIVASICPKVIDGAPRDTSFGYNPAVDSIADALADGLKFTCLPRPLDVAPDGSVPCMVLETMRPKPNQACDCSPAGRRVPDPAVVPALWRQMAKDGLCGGTTNVPCESECVCEILPAGTESDGDCTSVDTPLEACQCQENPTNVVGYCYIDPEKGIGSSDLVQDCKGSAARAVRLVSTPQSPTPRSGSTTFVACVGAAFEKAQNP